MPLLFALRTSVILITTDGGSVRDFGGVGRQMLMQGLAVQADSTVAQ